MYMMYVDESGDSGLVNSPSDYFALSGIVVHEKQWRDFMNTLVAFKKTMKALHNLPVRGEIHAAEFIRHKMYGLDKGTRLAILRNALDELAKIPYIRITNVIVNKTTKGAGYDVFESAWRTLFQRFENTMVNGNFPGGHKDEYGVVFTDATNGMLLTRMMRRMSVWNPIPNDPAYGAGYRNMPVTKIIEDPHGKVSGESLAIQMADV